MRRVRFAQYPHAQVGFRTSTLLRLPRIGPATPRVELKTASSVNRSLRGEGCGDDVDDNPSVRKLNNWRRLKPHQADKTQEQIVELS